MIIDTEKNCFTTDTNIFCNVNGNVGENNVVYRIELNDGSCKIGHTTEQLPTRINKYNEKDNIFKKMSEQRICTISILYKCNDTEKLKSLEQYAIYKEMIRIISENTGQKITNPDTVLKTIERFKNKIHNVKFDHRTKLSEIINKVNSGEIAIDDYVYYHPSNYRCYNYVA